MHPCIVLILVGSLCSPSPPLLVPDDVVWVRSASRVFLYTHVCIYACPPATRPLLDDTPTIIFAGSSGLVRDLFPTPPAVRVISTGTKLSFYFHRVERHQHGRTCPPPPIRADPIMYTIDNGDLELNRTRQYASSLDIDAPPINLQ